MNSSTNNPSRFQFETDFEQEEERQERLRQEALTREANGENPKYNDNDIARVQRDAYQQGYDKAMQDAKAELDQSISVLASELLARLQILLDAEHYRWNETQRLAVATTMASLKKFWPQLIREYGADAVEDTVRQSLNINNTEARIVVRVHDKMLDGVVNRLPQLKEQEAFAGNVIVLADDTIGEGDCKVEWADGGLERLSRTLTSTMDDALNRILAGLQAKPAVIHNPETERTSS